MNCLKTIGKALILGALVLLSGRAWADDDTPTYASGESVLWWMVDSWGETAGSTVTLGDGTVVPVEGYVSGDGYVGNAARMYAIDSQGNKTALHFFYDENLGSDGGTTWVRNGTTAMLYDDSTPPEWTGQPWTPADLSDLTGDLSTYSFMVELGNLTDDNVWTTLANSAEVSYATLLDKGYISTLGVTSQPQTPWAPNFVVPEPSSGLLLLIGSALLALRRRRADQVQG